MESHAPINQAPGDEAKRGLGAQVRKKARVERPRNAYPAWRKLSAVWAGKDNDGLSPVEVERWRPGDSAERRVTLSFPPVALRQCLDVFAIARQVLTLVPSEASGPEISTETEARAFAFAPIATGSRLL